MQDLDRTSFSLGFSMEHLGPLRERLKLLLGPRTPALRRNPEAQPHPSYGIDARSSHAFFSIVTQATLTRQSTSCISYYTRTSDAHTDREVSPQRIVFYRGNWYLDAWCHLRQDLRSCRSSIWGKASASKSYGISDGFRTCWVKLGT